MERDGTDAFDRLGSAAVGNDVSERGSGIDLEAELTKQNVAERLFGGSAPLRLGRYLLVRKLGAGGMGVVFEAYDDRLDRNVAVKVLAPHRAADARAIGRMLREARAMARVSHPHVVQVYDVDDTTASPYIAMELVSGPNLATWLRGRAWSDEMLDLFMAIARGLHAAHAQGVVHRDFKPENVLLTVNGQPKVADFGLAFTEDGGALTRTGEAMGTPAYMAPEQLAGSPPTQRSDQFAFCVALHEAIAAKHPQHRPPWVPRTARHKRIAAILRRGLSPDPDRRYADMEVLASALASVRRPSRRPAMLALAAVLLGGGALGALQWVRDSEAAREPRAANVGSGSPGLREAPERVQVAHAPRVSTLGPSSPVAVEKPVVAAEALASGETKAAPGSAGEASRGGEPNPSTRERSRADVSASTSRRPSLAGLKRTLRRTCAAEERVRLSFVVSPEGTILMPIVSEGSPAAERCVTRVLAGATLEISAQSREVELDLDPSKPKR